jgi:methionyl-tRNA synthetase
MDTDELVRINLGNAGAVARGNYSGLLCPKCKRLSAEAFFSEHNLKAGYGIWFECQLCGNVEHISCRSKPDGFDPSRISEKFQRLDERAWEAE